MKLISRLPLLCILAAVLLNSCTTLVLNSTTIPENNSGEQPVDEVLTQKLTKAQQQAKFLKAQPNLYKKQGSARKSGLSVVILDQFQQGLLLKKQGKYSKAKELFISMSDKHPNLSGVWLQLALIEKEQGKQAKNNKKHSYKMTTRYLNNAISANPLNYLAHNELAQISRIQGLFQQALAQYDSALKSWPAFALGYLNRGILYDLYLGRKSQALADYELYQALSDDPSRQLKGWIVDLQRQIKKGQQMNSTGATL